MSTKVFLTITSMISMTQSLTNLPLEYFRTLSLFPTTQMWWIYAMRVSGEDAQCPLPQHRLYARVDAQENMNYPADRKVE